MRGGDPRSSMVARRWPQTPVRIPHRRGVVMIITLLAIVLLAALVFYVMNLGRQANARIVTQHSADAAAIGGAGWVARSLNTVAMNNVAISRYLALINTLDACPLTTLATLGEQTALRDALSPRQAFTMSGVNAPAHQQLQTLLDELNEEVTALTSVNDYFNSQDIGLMTRYNSANGRGQIWRAMESLDQFSQATMENLGPLAQLNAIRGGEVNMEAAQPDSAALLLPASPQVPWRRGGFDDFEKPVSRGRLPVGVDDQVTNRGPYDAVFGWRVRQRTAIPGTGTDEVDPNGANGVDTDGQSSPFGGGPANAAHHTNAQLETISYDTYGTQRWTLQLLADQTYRMNRPNLRRSRFFPWVREISNAKLRYVWPGDGSKYFPKPVWDIAYPADLPDPATLPLPFCETGYFRLDFRSQFPYLSGQFGASGFTVYDPDSAPLSSHPDTSYFRVIRYPGWWLPLRRGTRTPQYMQNPMEINGRSPGVHVYQLAPLVWVYEMHYTVISDPAIGIIAQYDADGRPIPQDAYYVQLVIYAGVNRNLDLPSTLLDGPNGDDDILISNPYDGFDRTAASAPAPTDLDHAQVGPTADARRQYLTFLGIARQSDRSLLWPTRFESRQPYPNNVALAQAKVFNDHSWDLWTQMWHSQLEPVRQFDDWLGVLDQAGSAGGPNSVIPPTELEQLTPYLHSLGALAPVMMNH